MRDKHAELQALKREIFESLHCALPGTVVSYDAESQTAVIRPAVVRRAGGCSPLPLLRDVPVFMPVSFEVNPGDVCLVVFADCDIDAWFESGEAVVPASGRMHSLSDGFAFVGFRTGRNVYANLQGQSTYTRDEVGCAWNSKISILENGGLTITFTD